MKICTSSPQEVALLQAFRRNPVEARTMILNLTITMADIFDQELEDAIAKIDAEEAAMIEVAA